MDIKECIKGQVTFEYYRKNEFWYKCENGYMFPVPLEDIGDATFMAKDKGLLFMRYIRKHLALAETLEDIKKLGN